MCRALVWAHINALWAVADLAAVQVKGMLSTQHDARLEHEVMSQLQQEQTNEQDAAHIVYENQLSAEREALDQQVLHLPERFSIASYWYAAEFVTRD